MFCARMFCNRMFARRFFPKTGQDAVPGSTLRLKSDLDGSVLDLDVG